MDNSLPLQSPFPVWLAAVWLLWLPGVLITGLLRLPRPSDKLLHLALQIGLGLAFWPLLFLWTSVLGWSWSAPAARSVVVGIGIGGLFLLVKDIWDWWASRRSGWYRAMGWFALFGLIALLTISTRLQHIRNLVLPPWVDSVHHTMIVRLLLEHGTLPETYAPFIPHSRFIYHWGYHAIVTWLAWFLDIAEPLAVARLILHFGQALNALIILAVYAAGRVLFDSRWAGLLAAALTGLISWYPAYYLTWGRYTHLTGLLVLPVFVISLWQLRQQPKFNHWLLNVILGAGLLLIHIRVAFFAVTLLIVLGGALLVQQRWRSLSLWMLTGVGVCLLTLPWLFILLNAEPLSQVVAPPMDPQEWRVSNPIDAKLVWVPHNSALFALATGGMSSLFKWGEFSTSGQALAAAWLLLLIGTGLRNWTTDANRPSKLPTSKLIWSLSLLLGWCLLTAFLLNLPLFGLPPIRVLNNSSGIITLFLPLSLAGSGLLVWVCQSLLPHRWANAAMAGLIIGGSVWGASQMTEVINPVTVLAQPEDVKALKWVQENTPSDVHFVVNVGAWYPNTYRGIDGGYWLPILTDRTSVLPPALYTLAAERDKVREINTVLEMLQQPKPFDYPELRHLLQVKGVTHIYIGASTGRLNAKDLLQSPFVQLVYQDGDVHIFRIESNK